jgi:hypothetical protein
MWAWKAECCERRGRANGSPRRITAAPASSAPHFPARPVDCSAHWLGPASPPSRRRLPSCPAGRHREWPRRGGTNKPGATPREPRDPPGKSPERAGQARAPWLARGVSPVPGSAGDGRPRPRGVAPGLAVSAPSGQRSAQREPESGRVGREVSKSMRFLIAPRNASPCFPGTSPMAASRPHRSSGSRKQRERMKGSATAYVSLIGAAKTRAAAWTGT